MRCGRLIWVGRLIGLILVVSAGALFWDYVGAAPNDLAFTASCPVTITANVPPSLSCGLSTGAINFGEVNPSNTRYATVSSGSDSEVVAHTLQAATNATGGYNITIIGPTPAAGSRSINPIGPVPLGPEPGDERYGLRAQSAGGTGTVASPFNTNGYAYHATESAKLFGQALSPSNPTTYSVYYMANVGDSTPSGTYQAEETYSCVGFY